MSKIILQASSFKKNYNIETVAITASEYASSAKVTLEIKPNEGFVVDASDFSNSYLGEGVISVTYKNARGVVDFANQVIVTVRLAENLIPKGGANRVITILVNGIAKTTANELLFTDETHQVEGIIVTDKLGSMRRVDSSITKERHLNTYIVGGTAGEKGILLQKTFSAESGYYLEVPPKWNLKARVKDNYSIITKEFKDDSNRLVKKIYEIHYTFPSAKFVDKYQDKIIFS